MKTTIILIVFISNLCLANDEDPFWMPLNMPEGGDVHDIICSGGDTLYIYGGNGIFRSTDYAESWQQIKRGYTKYAAVDSRNYIFASEPMGNNSYFKHSFIVRSLDYGASWDTLDNVWNWIDTTYEDIYTDRFVRDMAFDLNNRLYAVVNYDDRSKSSMSDGDFRIVYTDDLGDTWKVVDTSYYYPPQGIHRIFPYKDSTFAFQFFDDNNSEKRIISFTDNLGKTIKHFEFDKNTYSKLDYLSFISDKEFYVVFSSGIFFTNNKGEKWEDIDYPGKGVINVFISSFWQKYKNDFYICVRYHNSFIDSLYHTTDNGLTWEQYSTQDNEILNYLAPNNILIDSKSNLYLSDEFGIKKQKKDKSGFKRSTKGYVNYSLISSGYPDIECDKYGYVYFGYNGMNVSSDNGITWERYIINKKRINQTFLIGDNLLLAKGYDELYKINEYGKSWELWNADPPVLANMVIDHDGIVFATPGNNFMFRSIDSGRTFEGLPNVHAGEAIAINNEGNLFAGNGWGSTGGIYMSTDKGESWIQKYKVGDNYEYLCTDKALYIIFHPSKAVGFEIVGNCFYMTTDNGETWEYKEYIPDRPGFSYEMALDSLGNFWGGYYRSTNDGQFWEKIDSGIDATHKGAVFSMGVNSEGYIFLITRYGGIYRSRDRYVSVEDNYTNSSKVILSPPIPNPTSGETKTSFELPESGEVNIKVSDVLGNIIINRSNKYYSQGRHTDVFNFDSYPSGIYLISLYGNSEVKTEKVEVVK